VNIKLAYFNKNNLRYRSRNLQNLHRNFTILEKGKRNFTKKEALFGESLSVIRPAKLTLKKLKILRACLESSHMSESAKNQMNARSKAKRLAKANVEPCDNAGVDIFAFPLFCSNKGLPKNDDLQRRSPCQ
jgi:hypothetical protein